MDPSKGSATTNQSQATRPAPTSPRLERSTDGNTQVPVTVPEVVFAPPRENSLPSVSSTLSGPLVESAPSVQIREPGHVPQSIASSEDILQLAASLHAVQEDMRRQTSLQQIHTEHARMYSYSQDSLLRYLIEEPEHVDLLVRHLEMDALEGVWARRADSERDAAEVYADLDRMCRAACGSKVLRSLTLTSTGFMAPGGAAYLGKALYQLISQSGLTHFRLQGFTLPPEGWGKLKAALANNVSLRLLMLKPSQIDLAGLQQLVDGVLAHSCLQELSLELNGTLDDGRAMEIRRLLLNSKGLKRLAVSGFASTWQALSVIFEGVSGSASLKHLALQAPGDAPLPKALQGVLGLLGQHTSLQTFEMCDLKLDLQGARRWCDFMETSSIRLPSEITIVSDEDEAGPEFETEKQELLARMARYSEFDEESKQIRSRQGAAALALALALRAGFQRAGHVEADSDLLNYMESIILNTMPRMARGKDSLRMLNGSQPIAPRES